MLDKHLKQPSERKYSGIYTDPNIGVLMNYGRVGVNRYNDRQIMHEPMFLNALRMLIDYERPSYVLEFGAFQGGLSAYMSDAAKNCDHQMKIISFDIDVYHSDSINQIDSVELVQLDVLDVKHYLTSSHEMIAGLQGKKFVIDDIGINTSELFFSIDPYLVPGDHYISCHTLDISTHDELLVAAEDEYLVNAMACDMFGENFVENPNGFLVKH